jgi:hypothetical protein
MVNQSGNALTLEQLNIKLDKPKKIVKTVIPNPVLGFDKRFDEMLTDITDEAKQIINKFPKPNKIIKGKGGYNPYTKEMRATLKGKNTESYRRTLLHEYGHHLDRVFLNPYRKQSIYMSKYRLDMASKRDARALGIDKGMSSQSDKMTELRLKLTSLVEETSYGGRRKLIHPVYGNISDIIDSLTIGKFRSDFRMTGHGTIYYMEGGLKSQMTENFANLFLLWSDNKAWAFTKEMFPNLAKEFEVIMKEALDGKLLIKEVANEFVKPDFSKLNLSPSVEKLVEKTKQNVEEVIDKARIDFINEWKVYHGGDAKFVAKLKKTNTFTVRAGHQKEAATGGNRFGLSTSKDFSMSKDFSTSTGKGDVIELFIHPEARVLRLKNKTLDDFTEAETRRLKKDYDVIIDEDNVGGEMEWRLLNPDVLRTEGQIKGYFNLFKEDALRSEIVGVVAKKVVKKVEKKIQAGLGLLDRTKLKKLKAKEADKGLTLLEKETVKRLEKKEADIIKKSKEEAA